MPPITTTRPAGQTRDSNPVLAQAAPPEEVANNAGVNPGHQRDEFHSDSQAPASSNCGFSFGNTIKKFFKGIFSPFTVFFEHPVIALAALVTGIAACSLIPVLIPIIGVGFGAYSIYQTVRGIGNVIERYKSGDYDGAENAFEDIGAGVSGVLMGILGIRASAAVAAEAKAAQAAIQAGKTGEQIIEASAVAAHQVKNMTFLQALNENVSILTTSQGRSTLFAQLKPSAIKQRVVYIRDYFKKSPYDRVKTKITHEESDFVLSPEGQRRAKLTKADIKKEANQVLTEVLDDLGVPHDIRPKFKIDDELRFLTKEEIECRVQEEVFNKVYCAQGKYATCPKSELPQVQVFQKGEVPQQFTKEQIIEKVKSTLSKVCDEMGVPQDKRYLENLCLGDREYLGAGFNAHNYEMNYHANSYRRGVFTLEEALAHEVEHLRHAILRARLGDSERVAIVQDEIIQGILRGETEEIILRGNFFCGPAMMKPPKIKPAMKRQIVDLVRNEIFPNSKKYNEAFYDRYMNSVKDGSTKPVTPSRTTGNLSQDLQTLESRIEAIVDANPDFVQGYSGGRSEAIKHLIEYMEAQSTRYIAFGQPEINNAAIVARIRQSTLTTIEKEEAIQSLRGLIPMLEGNGRNQKLFNFFHDKEAFNQYQFSTEEIMARNSAAKFEAKRLKAKMAELKQKRQLKPEQEKEMLTRLDELDFEINRNNIGQESYRAYTRHINEPDNQEFLAELRRLEEEYKVFEKKIETKKQALSKKTKVEHAIQPFPIRRAPFLRGWDDSRSKDKSDNNTVSFNSSHVQPALVKVSLA